MGKGKASKAVKANKKAKKRKKALKALKNALAPDRSPLAPAEFPDLPIVDGVRFASGSVGMRYTGRPDLMLVEIAAGSTMAGVFTRSATRSAAVLDCETKLAALTPGRKAGFGIVVNSGNANTFTGERGERDVAAISAVAAKALGLQPGRVFTASTGVIGEALREGMITDALPGLAEMLDPGGAKGAARAILTTDTFPKGAMAEVEIEGRTATIVGFAKGSGMIAPDMATMLGYVFTDAAVEAGALQAMLRRATDRSFNAITVDSDTSTSDTVMVAATGRIGNKPLLSRRSADGRRFATALEDVLHDLALQIVRDGEGATKLVEVRVTGARTPRDADRVARSIANSPLVKTAIAGSDPNWGRIVMAVGKSGATADRDLLSIRLGDILVAENGWVAEGYREKDGAAYMARDELLVQIDLGIGKSSATVWTCDLTKRYIAINADYRS